MSGSGNVNCNRVFIGLREITPPVIYYYTELCVAESVFLHAHMSARGWGITVGDKKDGREKSLWERSSNAGLVSACALKEFQSTIFSTHSTRIL